MKKAESCRMGHELYGLCELDLYHVGPHSRVPGGSVLPNTWADYGFCMCGRPFMDAGPGIGVECTGGFECTAPSPFSPLDRHVEEEESDDPVGHPKHYTRIPGVEVWDVLKYFPYLRGNALKYLLRAGYKTNTLEDLKKAQAYIQKEIEELERGNVRVSRMHGD